jgi:uncharacterized repeat protein (TIGR02543 family)
MKKKVWVIAVLIAVLGGILLPQIAGIVKKSRTALSSNAYVEEWDVIMEITDKGAGTEEPSTQEGEEQEPSELKKWLDEQRSISTVIVAIIDTGLDYEGFGQKERVIDIDRLTAQGAGDGTRTDSLTDENGHGTEMAEIIAANSGDRVRLMPIRVTGADGRATVAEVCQAIGLAAENGADVINLSMNTLNSATSTLLEHTIRWAVERGITVVVSAGNKQADVKDISPANVESATVISAVDEDGRLAEYSNYGDTIDYSAPGSYRGRTGTSYAAAYYSGVLAEVLSKGWTADILDSYACDRGTAGWDRFYGNGIVTLAAFPGTSLIQEVFGDGWEELDDSTILKMNDFHFITDSKIDEIVLQSDLADVGYYLSSLSAEALGELLERDTILTQQVNFCEGTFSDEELLDGDMLRVTGEEECLYYEKCLREYERESAVLGTSAAYLNKTGYFFLSFYDETGSGLSTRYRICARVCLDSKSLTGADLSSGLAADREVTELGNSKNKITVWSVVSSGRSDTMNLSWYSVDGAVAVFKGDGSTPNGRIFIPYIAVDCPAYTLMYTEAMTHADDGDSCAGRGNFYQYTEDNSNASYASHKSDFHLRKYGMQTTVSTQQIAPQVNTSHMNLSDTSRSLVSNGIYCTMSVYLSNPWVTLTINPSGETWGGTTVSALFGVINAQSRDLGSPTVTKYTATFYGGGDEADPVADTQVGTTKAFSYWSLTCTKDGSGAHGSSHSYMTGTVFTAGTVEYDQNSSTTATRGEKVTATAVFSGNLTITFPAAPTRSGYTFAGWYTGAAVGAGVLACSPEQAGSAEVTLSADTAYHAEWTANEYTVSFYNGDTLLAAKNYRYRSEIDLSTSQQVETADGSYYYVQMIDAAQSVSLQKTGYLLVGWSLTNGGTVVPFVSVPANNDTRLYPVWSRPTSGMRQVVVAAQSGASRGQTVIPTTGTASVNRTLGLRAYLYQADIPVTVDGSGVSIPADGTSYAEDNAGNKTPLAGSAASLPVRCTFLYKYYCYNAVTAQWDYMESCDSSEIADVPAGGSYTYVFVNKNPGNVPQGYTYHHAEYQDTSVTLPYSVQITGVQQDSDTIRTLNIYYYPVTCTLTFDANGGTFLDEGLGDRYTVSGDGTTAVRQVLYGSSIGSFPGAQRALYSFTGFYADRSGGSAFHMNDTVTGDMVLYAGWSAKSGIVRYDAGSNQGTVNGKSSLDTLVVCGTAVPYGSYTAKRSGYEFFGWSTEAQNTPAEKTVQVQNPATDTVWMESEAMTLYAQFARTLQVRFHQWDAVEAGRQADGSAPVLYNNETSVTVVSPSIRSYAGWEVCGWSADKGASADFDIGEGTALAVDGDRDYYAVYTRQVTVTYDTNMPEEDGIQFADTDTAAACRSTGSTDDLPAVFVIKEAPNRSCYTFAYWQGSDGRKYEPGEEYRSVSDLTLTAVWQADTAIVIYDAQMNGGTIEGKPYKTVELAYGSEIPADSDTFSAEKPGFVLLGWNTDPEAHAGLLINPDMDEETLEKGGLTLYAIYKKSVTARFHQQGETTSQSVSVDLFNNMESVTVHAPAVAAYTGWEPMGWTTGTAGSAEVELCADADFVISEDTDYYARYEKPVILAYDAGVRSIDIAPDSGVTYHNTYDGSAKYDEPAVFTAAGIPPQEGRSFLYWTDTDGLECATGDEIRIYEDELLTAVWDEYPEIYALDRYFTLEQATDAAGTYLNEAALLDTDYVAAEDREDGSLAVTLQHFYPEDFRALTGSADLMIYFQATDSYGHTRTATATVHVVDTAVKEEPVTASARFLSPAYYRSDGNYVAEADGGLSSTSLWVLDGELAAYLSQAMANVSAADGERSVCYYSSFTSEEIQAERTQILGEGGFGKYKSVDRLREFVETYIKKDSGNPES